jgi:hypothetical protein
MQTYHEIIPADDEFIVRIYDKAQGGALVEESFETHEEAVVFAAAKKAEMEA